VVTDLQQRKVLLVGKRRLYLDAIREVLDSSGKMSASVVSASEPTVADCGEPDLIVIDCPYQSEGFDALTEDVRARYPNARTMLLTPWSGRESLQRASKLGADGCLCTGWSIADLVSAIAEDHDPRRRTPRSGKPAVRNLELLLASLSERELSVLRAIVSGSTTAEIAKALGISVHTVRTHVQHVMAKLVVRSQAEMVSVALRAGIPPSRRSRAD